jgi:hypothetical protein
MGRRPKFWNFRTHRSKRWRTEYKDETKEISKFDIERYELLPFSERTHRQRYRNHYLKSPIERFLMDQVGRDYDDVFSELVQHIPRKYHECLNINDYKMPSSHHPEVSRWYMKEYWQSVHGFYVDLETRVLCFHERVGRRKEAEEVKVKPVYKPFSIVQFKMTRNDYGQKYVFNQLLTYEDFEDEAVRMRHCIRTYWQRCTYFNQQVSIWSLTCGNAKVMTIEVNKGEIYQVRGHLNRKANENERLIIESWAKWLHLGIREFAF